MRPTHLNTPYKHDLSPRQREVLDLVARGLTNGEIAQRLGISLDGAKYHVREILGKLGVDTREEAAVWWRDSKKHAPRLPASWPGLLSLRMMMAAGGGVLAVAAVVALVLLRAGSHDGHPPVTPVAPTEQTTQVVAEEGGPAGFETFVRQELAPALTQDNIGFVQDRFATIDYVCQQGELTTTGCERPGQVVTGVAMGTGNKDGGLADLTTAREMLSLLKEVQPAQRDTYGSGAPQVYAIDTSGEAVRWPVDHHSYVTILTAIVQMPPNSGPDADKPTRVVYWLPWELRDGKWVATGVFYQQGIDVTPYLDPAVAKTQFPGWRRLQLTP